MDRSEKVGLGVALVGHVLLFALLSASLLTKDATPPLTKPMDVSLVDEVALEATAPAATEAPAASKAPEVGPIEDSPPPAPAEPEPPQPQPEPQPQPRPEPEPAPPAPAPKPQPKPQPKPVSPPRSAPVAKAKPKPPAPAKATPAKPKPAAKPAAAPKVASKPATKPATKPAAKSAAKSSATAKPNAKPAAKAGSGDKPASQAARPRGGSLGDIMKGIVPESEPKAKGTTPRVGKLDAKALAGIQDAIRRQIQPCADRQVDPGPGANEISTTLNLRFRSDGTLSATPTVVRQSGAEGENARYKQRVVDLGIAALKACAPLRLPPEYYRTAAGGWSNINFIWKLR